MGLVAASVLTVAAADELFVLVAPAAETAATSSIQTVVRRAQMDELLGMPWQEALVYTDATLSQGGEAITIDGTVVRWSDGTHCHEADVPTASSPVVVTAC